MYKRLFHVVHKIRGEEIFIYQGKENYFVIMMERSSTVYSIVDFGLENMYPVNTYLKSINFEFDPHSTKNIPYSFDINLLHYGSSKCPEWIRLLIEKNAMVIGCFLSDEKLNPHIFIPKYAVLLLGIISPIFLLCSLFYSSFIYLALPFFCACLLSLFILVVNIRRYRYKIVFALNSIDVYYVKNRLVYSLRYFHSNINENNTNADKSANCFCQQQITILVHGTKKLRKILKSKKLV